MKRRHFISNTALGTTVATVLGSCTNNAIQKNNHDISLPFVHWKMQTSWPRSLDTIFGGAQTICDRVNAMSGGKFVITPYASGEIVPGLEVLDAVQQGTVECGHSSSYYYIGKNSTLGFGTSMPFGFNAQQQNAWLYHGGGLEAMNRVYSDFNIISFPAGNTGAQMGGWYKQEVNTVSDLKGLKMRIPGLGGQVMSRLGVNVQVLPGGEIFLALDTGAVDAAEWIGPYDDQKLGLNKAASYYYYPGWWELGATLDLQINKEAWRKLPKEYQYILKAASIEANSNMLSKYDAQNRIALQSLLKEGTILVPYSKEIMQAARIESFALYEENANKNKMFREVYESWNKFREEISQWNRINELSYGNFISEIQM